MPIDPAVLAEALDLVAKNGMSNFAPKTDAPASTGGELVAISAIDTFTRNTGEANFDKPDPDRPGVIRSTSILVAIQSGACLPPIQLFQRAGEKRYELVDGYHRLHLIAALGYTHVWATITDWKPGEY